jgi:beta-xylosidase
MQFNLQRTRLTLPESTILRFVLILFGFTFCTLFGEVAISVEDRIEVHILADQDGGPLNPVYKDFAQGGESTDPEYYAPVWHQFRRLRPRTVRFDHVLNGFTSVERGTDGLEADFTKLDRMVDLVMEAGAEPIMCLSYVPEGIQTKTEIDPPNMSEWEELVERTVRHLNGERSLGIQYWEVWNEPNLDGFWGGTREEYLQLYAASCRGALRADPTVKMGGGGFSGFDEGWTIALLDFAKENHLPLDFLSWHEYYGAVETYVAHVYRAEGLAAERGMNPELIIDEWNFHAGLVPENDDHRGAVYVADFVARMLDTPVDYTPFFEIKDGWKADAVYWGRWGMFTFHNTPKANYFCFLFHSRLTDQRVPLRSFDEDVNGIATRDRDGLIFTLYNRSEERKVAQLAISGLPEEATAYSWTRYLIDRWHSNPARGTRKTAEKVETVRPLISRRGEITRPVVLPPESVSLVEIREELWSPGIALDVVPGERDPRHPDKARFHISIENLQREPLSIALLKSFTHRGESLPLDGVPLPFELESRSKSFACEVLIPELGDSGDVFFTVRARTGTGEEAVASGSISVPASLEARFDPQQALVSENSDEAALNLCLTNNLPRTIYANVEWRWEPSILRPVDVPGYLEIEPYATVIQPIQFRIPKSARGRNFMVRCSACAAGGLSSHAEAPIARTAQVAHSKTPPTVDGDLGDWRDRHRLLSFEPQSREIPHAPRGSLWMAWDAENLYIAAHVIDVSHMQNERGIDIWRNDGIQIAFDTSGDARPDKGYDEDDMEIGFALSPDGPASWCWYDRGDHNPGPVADGDFAIVRDGDTTSYEIALPFEALLPDMLPEAQTMFGVSILVNDWDGSERHIVEWGSGIANQKLPWQFRQVRLMNVHPRDESRGYH